MKPKETFNIRQGDNSEISGILRLVYQLSMLPFPSSNCMDKIKDLLTDLHGATRETKKVMNEDYTLEGLK